MTARYLAKEGEKIATLVRSFGLGGKGNSSRQALRCTVILGFASHALGWYAGQA